MFQSLKIQYGNKSHFLPSKNILLNSLKNYILFWLYSVVSCADIYKQITVFELLHPHLLSKDQVLALSPCIPIVIKTAAQDLISPFGLLTY